MGISPALAAESISQPLTFTSGTTFFGAEKTSDGDFTDIFTFDLASAAIGNGGVLSVALPTFGGLIRDIDFTSITISGAQGVLDFTPLLPNDLFENYLLLGANLLAGTQTLTILGTVSGGSGSYGAVFNLDQSAVPEPSAWGIMLAGLGAVGYTLRRKKRQPVQAV